MTYEAGIAIKMSENAVERLTAMENAVTKLIPQMEKLQQSIGSVGSMRGINKSLNQMAQNLEKVEKNSGGLKNVQNQLDQVGNSARRNTGHIERFGGTIKRMVGGAVGQLSLLAGAYLSVNTLVEGFKKGMDVQQQMGALSFAGFNTKQKSSIFNSAISLSQRYATTPGEMIHYAKFALGAGLSQDEAVSSMTDAARFEHAMKKVIDPKVQQENMGDFGLKIAELAGKRNPKGIKELQDILVKTEGVYGGILPMDQLLRQYSMMRMGRIGGDPQELMLIAGHFLAEQMGGKGGSGSSGGVGIMLQAWQRAMVQGALPLGAIQNLQKAGGLEGADAALAKMAAQHKSRGGAGSDKFIHITRHGITTDASGMHIVSSDDEILDKHRAGRGGRAYIPKLTPAAMREFGVRIKDTEMAQHHPMEYMFERFIPMLERFKGWTPGTFMSDKSKLNDTQRADAISEFMPGTRATLLNLIADLTIYHKRIESQKQRMGKMPGVDRLDAAEDQTKVKLQVLSGAWEAFNVKLFNNKHVIDAINITLDRLTDALRTITQYIDPVVNFFARIGFLMNPEAKTAPGNTEVPTAVGGLKLGQYSTDLAGPPKGSLSGGIVGAAQNKIEGWMRRTGKFLYPGGTGPLPTDAMGKGYSVGKQGDLFAPPMPTMGKQSDREFIGNIPTNPNLDYSGATTASLLQAAGGGDGGGALSRARMSRSSQPSGGTTINFHAPVYTHSPDELTNHIIKKVDAHQKKQALTAGYTKSAGSGLHQSPYLSPAVKQ